MLFLRVAVTVFWCGACFAGWIGSLAWAWNLFDPGTFWQRVVLVILFLFGGAELLALPFALLASVAMLLWMNETSG